MCTPTIFTAVGGAVTKLGGLSKLFTVGSGLVGAYSQITNANAQAAALEEQAKLSNQQAKEETAASLELLDQGKEESRRRRRAGAIQLGDQKAAMAANGLDVEGNMAIDMLDDTSTIIAEDAFSIRETARLNAEGRTQQARNYRAQAQNNQINAANTRSAGRWGAISTVLTSGARVSSRFKKPTLAGSY